MRFISLSLLMLLCGCGPYMQAQMDLVEQARAGVRLLAEHQQGQSMLVSELHRLRRLRLDEAFDADVRERQAIDAEWVIEARNAYAVAMDVLAEARFASVRAEETARENVESTHDALDRLRELIEVQARWLDR